MSFRERIRAWFKGEKRAPKRSRAPMPPPPSTDDLEAFLRTRTGVEGYLEPKTAVYSTTLLLVAGDGEYLRRPVRDRGQAEKLCSKHGTPLYDAGKIGYPRRMRDYERGLRPDTVSLDDLPPWPGEDNV